MDKEDFIDCYLVGPHEMDFSKYEKLIRFSGDTNPAYRDLNLKYLKYQDKAFKISELLEKLSNEFLNKESDKLVLEDIIGNALAYLASYLHKRGYSFDYSCSLQADKNLFAEKIRNKKIRLIALITTTYQTPIQLTETISFIRKHNTDAKIIVGGPYVWYQAKYYDEKEFVNILKTIKADFYVVSSQGEDALTKVIDALRNNTPFDNINNLYYKLGDNYFKTNEAMENNNLEENTIEWTLFKGYNQKMGFVRTSMSCLYSCAFCDFPARVGKYSAIDVSYVEKELNSLKQAGNITFFRFIDDTFNIPQDRYKEILKMMIRNKYNFKWSAFYRCQHADEETIQLMVESGCQAVHLGIESGSPEILKNMNKHSSIDKYQKGLDLLNKYNIISYATFVIGFPGETQETINETLAFIEKSKPTFSLLWPWFCSPLTPIWKEREKYKISNWGTNWSHSTMDSNTVASIIEDILLNDKLKNSIFCSILSEYISYFINRGISLDQIKDFILAFNEGIKEKLINPQNRNISEIKFSNIRDSILMPQQKFN